MEELLDLIGTEESPSQISDKIKEILFAKSAERIDGYRSEVADSMFSDSNDSVEEEE